MAPDEVAVVAEPVVIPVPPGALGVVPPPAPPVPEDKDDAGTTPAA
jgi:hypothetical protein